MAKLKTNILFSENLEQPHDRELIVSWFIVSLIMLTLPDGEFSMCVWET